MNDTQRILVIGLLMMSGAAMAYVLLNFGEGAFSREDRIAILVLSGHGEDSITGTRIWALHQEGNSRRSLRFDSPDMPVCRCRFCRARREEARLALAYFA